MKDVKVAFMQHNLDLLTKFHNHVHGFFNDNLGLSQADDSLDRSQKNWLKSEYEVHLPNQLRKSVFLMMFGHLEEHLYLSWVEYGEPNCLNNRAYGLKKYNQFFTNYVGLNIGSDGDYQYLTDCQVVRNAIIHTAGRVSLLKEPDQLERVISKNKGCFETKNDRVYITHEGLHRFQKSVSAFTGKVI
ncbi:hypothetical protein V6473_004546 [Vibrio parahaemolyticus]